MDNLKIINKLPFLATLFAALVFLVSCDESTNPLNFNAFPVEQDVRLGYEVDQEMQNTPQEYPILNNPQATAYVQAIVDEIIQSPEVRYADVFPYEVRIVHDDETVNAFALPGGYIYVYTGLLKFLDYKETLAGILAHEAAHSDRRHATRRMTKAYGIGFVLGLLLGDDPGALEELAANIAANVTLLYNSRSDEDEADEYSFKYLQSTNYYPGAIKFFFEKVGDGSGGDFTQLFMTHPDPDDRLDEINKMIEEANLPTPNLSSAEYSEFKSILP